MSGKAEEIQKIITNSGNNFHSKVVEFLRQRKWSVLISPYYSDNQTDRSREIDIIAEKAFGMGNDYRGFIGYNIARLFIECKYITKPVVFWFDNKDKTAASKRILHETLIDPSENNGMAEKHHYLKDGDVAKLFASTKDEAANEPIYKAINQSLNALVYYENKITFLNRSHPIVSRPSYPLILLNDFSNIFRVSMGRDGYDNIADNYFQVEVNYAYLDAERKRKDAYFLIDVVDFTAFDIFLNYIENIELRYLGSLIAAKQNN